MRLFVSSIPYRADESDMRAYFIEAGYMPDSVTIQRHHETGDSRGFAFVELSEDGQEAIDNLDGAEFMGRKLTVREARPKPNGVRRV